MVLGCLVLGLFYVQCGLGVVAAGLKIILEYHEPGDLRSDAGVVPVWFSNGLVIFLWSSTLDYSENLHCRRPRLHLETLKQRQGRPWLHVVVLAGLGSVVADPNNSSNDPSGTSGNSMRLPTFGPNVSLCVVYFWLGGYQPKLMSDAMFPEKRRPCEVKGNRKQQKNLSSNRSIP